LRPLTLPFEILHASLIIVANGPEDEEGPSEEGL
jgi:hypothetical protein